MDVLGVFGVIGTVLLGVWYMIQRAKADKIITDLMVQPSEERIKDHEEIARLEQEIKDAKIGYSAARAELERQRRSMRRVLEESGFGDREAGRTDPDDPK